MVGPRWRLALVCRAAASEGFAAETPGCDVYPLLQRRVMDESGRAERLRRPGPDRGLLEGGGLGKEGWSRPSCSVGDASVHVGSGFAQGWMGVWVGGVDDARLGPMCVEC